MPAIAVGLVAATLGVVVGAAVVARRARARIARADAAVRDAERTMDSQARRAIEESETRRVILASMAEGVLLTDRDGRVTFTNEAYARHLGAAPETVERVLPLPIRKAVQRSGFTGATVSIEVETGVPPRWLRASAQAIGDDGSVLLVVRDVTEARRIDAVRRDFVANASHELKTPIASILAAAETLRDGAIDDPIAARSFTGQLERDAARLSRLVSDLLDLSRLEVGSDRSELVHLDELARDEIERLTTVAAEAGVEIEQHLEGVAPIPGSARDLALLVRNLVENAIRYTARGGSVVVDVLAQPETVVLRVRDTGVGISQRDIGRIFERFYRVDQARSRDTGGTGLGLALVKHVCENHGGEILVESELGRGTAFEVRLPTAAPEATP